MSLDITCFMHQLFLFYFNILRYKYKNTKQTFILKNNIYLTYLELIINGRLLLEKKVENGQDKLFDSWSLVVKESFVQL